MGGDRNRKGRKRRREDRDTDRNREIEELHTDKRRQVETQRKRRRMGGRGKAGKRETNIDGEVHPEKKTDMHEGTERCKEGARETEERRR